MRRSSLSVCGLVLGAVLGSPAGPFVGAASGAPVNRMDAPLEVGTPGSCVAVDSILIVRGVSFDTVDGQFDFDRLEYRAVGSDTWVFVDQAATPISTPGALYNVSTAGFTEGLYVFRLSTFSTTGASAIDEAVVWISGGIDALAVQTADVVVAGKVCLSGTVDDANTELIEYRVDYRAADTAGPFLPVDGASPVSTGPVVNATLAVWDTTTLPDGDYDLRVTAFNACGSTREVNLLRVVDNTAPVVDLSGPSPCEHHPLDSVITIEGLATDDKLKTWTLSVIGGPFDAWQTIAGGSSDASGALASWNTAGLPACGYVLRLQAEQLGTLGCSGTLVSTTYRGVRLGCRVDLDDDGDIDIDDINEFVNKFINAACD